MKKVYLKVGNCEERINVDVYEPQLLRMETGANPSPAILVVCGGDGKDARSGRPSFVGKHAAGYHDLGEALSHEGFWAIVPSRRGDPQLTPQLRATLAPRFSRLPEELLSDQGPNEGTYSHRNHVQEVTGLVENLSSVFGPDLDVDRVGILGQSAGGGVALAATARLGDRISSVALWGSALRTSQWFTGPKADSFFKEVFDSRGVRYDRERFISEMCDAIDYVGQIKGPMLFSCAAHDLYAAEPPELDKWSSAGEQIELLRYAIHSRYGKVTVIKGAEHTMYKEHPAWRSYVSTLTTWFNETMSSKQE